jgi:hypothetical protein
MSKKLITICFALVLAAMSLPVYGDVLYQNTGIAASVPQVWPGTPAITTNPGFGPTWPWIFNYGYNNNRTMLGESFTVPADRDPGNCVLQAIAFVLSGTPTTGGFPIDDLRLVDLGTNGGELLTYPYNISADLLPITTWLYPGGDRQVGLLSFTCGPTTNDIVQLVPGHSYSFEFVETTFHGTLFWLARGSNLYSGGMGYQATFVLDDSGNPTVPYGTDVRTKFPEGTWPDCRDIFMAVYLTPEPATVALLALGGLALLRKRS